MNKLNKAWLLLIAPISICLFGCSYSAPSKKELRIYSYPNKTKFEIGEAFSSEGLVVVDNKTSERITDYTSSINDGYVFTQSDKSEAFNITLSKESYVDVSYTIRVVAKIVPELTKLTAPSISINNNVVSWNSVSHASGYLYSITGEGNKSSSLTSTSLDVSTLSLADGDYSISVIAKGDNIYYSDSDSSNVVSFSINSSPIDPPSNIDMSIYYINDTHGSFIRDADNYEAGISYISKYIKTHRDKYSLTLSGGDMFQGGYESNETRGKIMIEAMNEIGFDAMSLGNHEFDWGEKAIETFATNLDCDIISCNTFYSSDNVTRPNWLSPYTIVQKSGVKVGIIGAIQEGIETSITGSISNKFYFPSANSFIKEYSTYLRKDKGCDVIIASFHDAGLEGSSGEPSKFSDLTQTDPSTNLKYVDAMFFAHDHISKKGTYNGVPYLEAGSNGKYIGIMNLSLSYQNNRYLVSSGTPNVIYAYSNTSEADPNIEAITQKEEYRDMIVHADDPIYIFSKYYSKESFTYVVCQAMYWYVNSHKSEFDNVTIYFASHNTGGIRSTVNAGEMTRRKLIKVFPFDNLLSIQVCNSTNISNMEESSYYRTYKEDNPVYVNGLTHAVSISYITEYKYAYYYQQSYKNYDITARAALVAYLLSGVNPNL